MLMKSLLRSGRVRSEAGLCRAPRQRPAACPRQLKKLRVERSRRKVWGWWLSTYRQVQLLLTALRPTLQFLQRTVMHPMPRYRGGCRIFAFRFSDSRTGSYQFRPCEINVMRIRRERKPGLALSDRFVFPPDRKEHEADNCENRNNVPVNYASEREVCTDCDRYHDCYCYCCEKYGYTPSAVAFNR